MNYRRDRTAEDEEEKGKRGGKEDRRGEGEKEKGEKQKGRKGNKQ